MVIFPASGSGAWEAALVNTLSPGDRVLMVETGHFAILWKQIAVKLGLVVDLIPGDWRHGVDPRAVEARLVEDREHAIKAVCVVHNETSTGVASRIPLVRHAIDHALNRFATLSTVSGWEARGLPSPRFADYIPIPPMPPMPPGGMPPPASLFSSGISLTSASVVSSSAAIEAAFCNAARTTLVGSTTPASTRFS